MPCDPDALPMPFKRSVPASTPYCREQRRAGFRASRVMRKSSMGGVKTTFVYLTIPKYPNFGPFFLAFRGKKALEEI
jgi:hypothetical protein